MREAVRRTRAGGYPQRAKVIHRYYNQTGFYSFVGASLKKAIPAILMMVLGLVLINKYVLNFSNALDYVVTNFSATGIFSVFFASESFLGLLPPEVFIAWSAKAYSPIEFLSLLALLSYLGGVVSFFIGRGIQSIPSVHNYFESKMASYVSNTRKWGGFLIIVGALLPLPFSMASIAAGMIQYKFSHYLLFGLLRFVRFYIFALAIFHIV